MFIKWLFLFVLLQQALLAQIRGIFLTGDSKNIKPEGRKVAGIQMKDLSVPGGEETLKELLRPFLGQEATEANLIALKQKIVLYWASQRQSSVGVSLPPQKTTKKNSVIQILVSEKKFGRPIYKGEIWYSNEQLNQYLAIRPGQEIAEDALQNNLSWLNRNPFHYTEMKYVPNSNPNIVDIEFYSKTRRVLRFYTRADDTGSPFTGYGRFAGGFSWGNALWRGDLLSFEYQCSNHFDRLQSYTANYTCFLSWQHLFNVMGTYATIKPEIPKFNVTSKIAQVLFYYTIPFKPLYKPLQQSMILGIEYKYTNSNTAIISPSGTALVELPSVPVIQQLNISELYGNYTLNNKRKYADISLSLDFYASPGEILSHQSNADFNRLRTNSKNTYYYGYVTLGQIYTIPKILSLSLLLRGQVASDTLPPTELFVLGGYNTVRGYREAELVTDNGFIGNFEVRSPPIALYPKNKSQLTFLAFIDYGLGNNWYVPKTSGLKTPPYTQHLLGVGPGLRYTLNPYLQARVDYGFKLYQLFTNNHADQELRLGFGQFHFGLLMSY